MINCIVWLSRTRSGDIWAMGMNISKDDAQQYLPLEPISNVFDKYYPPVVQLIFRKKKKEKKKWLIPNPLLPGNSSSWWTDRECLNI